MIYPPCSEDCLFHGTYSCTNCDVCTYCGKYLYWSGKRKNIHVDHILAWVSWGRTKVPACKDCNLSKGRKGLKEWLRWLRIHRPKKWEQIVEYNKWKKHKIAQAVREVRDEQRVTQ
jgi:hypothetical protein